MSHQNRRRWPLVGGALCPVAIAPVGVHTQDEPPPTNDAPNPYRTTAGSTLPPILEFDASGKLLRSFGAGMFIFPHKDSARL